MKHRLLAATALLALAAPMSAAAQEKDSFRVAWSIYVGWMPWGYLEESGIMDKWAEKYGIDVEIVQINDYVESINQYTAGAFDGYHHHHHHCHNIVLLYSKTDNWS